MGNMAEQLPVTVKNLNLLMEHVIIQFEMAAQLVQQ